MGWLLPEWPKLAHVHCLALLGAESTGKTSLIEALQQRLQQHGVLHAVVPETLRSWCEAQQRLPRADEQAALAHGHAQHIHAQATALQAAATAASSKAVLLIDTTPLITALYSQYHFQDGAGLAAACAFERGVHQRLLMGLDLPWTPEPGMRDGPEHRAAFDRLLRQQLSACALPHTVIYGQGSARLDAAWSALQSAWHRAEVPPRRVAPTWRAACACCADPACEWALFSGLSAKASASGD